MDFLKNNRRISFTYGGKAFSQHAVQQEQTQNGCELKTVYTFQDGLTVTNVAKKQDPFGAYEWVSWFENTGSKPTEILSELWDCSCTLPFAHDDPLGWTAYVPDDAKATKIYAPKGSAWEWDDFFCDADHMSENQHEYYLFPGETKEYRTRGGRSSDTRAPFFNIHRQNAGVILAIGWSGQWNCRVSRTEDTLTLQAKIEDTHFRLLPGEKIRTASIVMLPYQGSMVEAQNQWRRLIKERYSLLGKPGRESYAPFCAGVWGGMTTKAVLDRIRIIKENDLPFEYIWMDAGWYGMSDKPSPDEFEGDWGDYTGDWRVNPHIHPDGMQEIVAAIREAGKKFLLWFEPERVICTSPVMREHPEYFFESPFENDRNRLLNLGDEAAWQYCYRVLAEKIEELHISFYRQDFNMMPLEFWRKRDAADRRGISEIKHIMGLYRLWDALLERFPHLLIDNCASGGKRIDIETLRRSVPLWRSDAQCPANYHPDLSQSHNISYSSWLPYSGTGTGRGYDTYRFRSAYAGGLTTNYTFSERDAFGDDPEKLAWLKKLGEEYLRVRPYFYGDVYPLTVQSERKDVWCAVQFDRPEEGDGIVQVFRREEAAYTEAAFMLGGICADKRYRFTDADGGQMLEISGGELLDQGFRVRIDNKRTAKIYFYQCL